MEPKESNTKPNYSEIHDFSKPIFSQDEKDPPIKLLVMLEIPLIRQPFASEEPLFRIETPMPLRVNFRYVKKKWSRTNKKLFSENAAQFIKILNITLPVKE